MGVEKKTIEIFLRARPVEIVSDNIQYDYVGNKVMFEVPKEDSGGYINNARESYSFEFDKIFGPHHQQDHIFEGVAKKSVLNSLEGYNCTIFAYGQTGSGKTWTINGGTKKYVNRGITPRCISNVFQEFSRRSDVSYQAQVSYMEIYNDTIYDLLDPEHEADTIEELPKVMLITDEDGKVGYKNLNKHVVNTEEQALNLLFLGETNRMIAETPLNPASSRSHCIFTIYFTFTSDGGNTITRSKLHLVDLAGSERTGKTGVHGERFREAIHINSSLHFLEQVIVQLQQKGTHISYRNSKITSVLRDSLGGNCRTLMVATISPDPNAIMESISTCRFSQRVACIRNKAVVNEEQNPQLLIQKLKREVNILRGELNMETAQAVGFHEISLEDREKYQQMVQNYLEDAAGDSMLIIREAQFVPYCFKVFKELVIKSKQSSAPKISATARKQILNLKKQIAQRDRELKVMVSLIHKKTDVTSIAIQCNKPFNANISDNNNSNSLDFAENNSVEKEKGNRFQIENIIREAERDVDRPSILAMKVGNENKINDVVENVSGVEAVNVSALLENKSLAFEKFLLQHPDNNDVKENSKLLNERRTSAKESAKALNASKKKIEGLRAFLEQIRIDRALKNAIHKELNDKNEDDKEITPKESAEELKTKRMLEREKKKYKQLVNRLQEIKSETESLDFMIRTAKQNLSKDFELWYSIMKRQNDEENDKREVKNEESSSPSPLIIPTLKRNIKSAPSRSPVSGSSPFVAGITKTGNEEADKEIHEFFQLRDALRRK